MKYLAFVLLLITSHVKAHVEPIEIGFLTADTNETIWFVYENGGYGTSVADFHYGIENQDWEFLHVVVGITFEPGYPHLVIYDGRDMSTMPAEYHEDACKLTEGYPTNAYSYTAFKNCL